jgi:chemotaxis protein MotD
MSNLNFVPRMLAPRTDAQAAKAAAMANDGTEAGGAGASSEFGSLLEDLAKEAPAAAGTTGKGRSSAPPLSAPGGAGELAAGSEDVAAGDQTAGAKRSVEDLLQVVAIDTSGGTSQGVSQAGSAAFSVLESLPPRILGQNGQNPGREASEAGSGRAHSSGLPAGPDQTVEGVLNSPSSPAVRVSVQRQETHFKPIVEGFTTKVVPQEQVAADAEAVASGDPLAPAGLKSSGQKGASSENLVGLASTVQPSGITAEVGPEDLQDSIAVKTPATDKTGAKSKVSAAGTEGTQKQDAPQSLPQGTLQRLASDLMNEAQQLAAGAKTRVPHAEAVFLTHAKASEGAVRLLNIQLHPADLGRITVKMKLSGDSLEMALQVESEETARLLKSDTEKLSNLLKGSGYRPEVITVQSPEAASARQDSAGASRQQSMSQSQQDAFQRGAQQQNGGSQREPGYQHERKGGRDDASAEGITSSRSTGGVYL